MIEQITLLYKTSMGIIRLKWVLKGTVRSDWRFNMTSWAAIIFRVKCQVEINHQSPLTIHTTNHITFLIYHNSEHHYYIRWNFQTSLDSGDQWLPLRSLKCQSLSRTLLKNLFIQTIRFHRGMLTHGGSNHFIYHGSNSVFPLLWKCLFSRENKLSLLLPCLLWRKRFLALDFSFSCCTLSKQESWPLFWPMDDNSREWV